MGAGKKAWETRRRNLAAKGSVNGTMTHAVADPPEVRNEGWTAADRRASLGRLKERVLSLDRAAKSEIRAMLADDEALYRKHIGDQP